MLSVLELYRDKRFFTLLCLGFVSGLPFLLILSTLTYWLSELGISKASMGLVMLVGIPYSAKFLWAPLLDHVSPPIFGKILGTRRGWAILAQFCLIISLLLLGWTDPKTQFHWTLTASFLISFFSATLDAVVDAYRIELLNKQENAIGASVEAIGFRTGMLTSGAGALCLASLISWPWAYTIMAMCIFLGIIAVIKTPLPDQPKEKRQKSWKRAVFISWKGLLRQPYFIPLLLFIFCFKCPDTVLNAMSAPFFFELGVSKIQFAEISKIFGVVLMVCGALVGGLMLRFLGDLHGAMIALFLQIVSSLMFVVQALVGYKISALIITVGVESFASGMTSAVFIAYLSKFCLSPHTATHFTILYSFGSLCRVLTSSAAAYLADRFPWEFVFTLSALGAVPGIIFLLWLERDKIPNLSERLSKIAQH